VKKSTFTGKCFRSAKVRFCGGFCENGCFCDGFLWCFCGEFVVILWWVKTCFLGF
jgi:hypothetical protein